MPKHVNVGVTAAEESEMSDCSLDITCSTVTQSASSPSEPDQDGSGLMTVLKHAEEAEMLSDCSTVSAENSTASAPYSSDAEPENTSRQCRHVLMADRSHKLSGIKCETTTVLKDLDTNCGILHSSTDTAVGQPIVMPNTNNLNKDQIVISASNRVQNYLAGLGLPGIFVDLQSGFIILNGYTCMLILLH